MARYLRQGLYAWIFLNLAAVYAIVWKLVFPPGASASLAFWGVTMPVETGILITMASAALSLSAFLEIVLSKNGTGWKLLWSAVVFLLSEIGVVAYYFLGRKSLTEEGLGKKKK